MMLTLDQAAERARLSRRTFDDWSWRVHAGLPVTPEAAAFVRMLRKFGRSLRVDETDFDGWLRAPVSGRRLDQAKEVTALLARVRDLEESARATGSPRVAKAGQVALAAFELAVGYSDIDLGGGGA